MNLKRTALAALVASIMVPPSASMADDRALFLAGAAGYGSPGAPMVRAGSAPIDEALSSIVPAPYRVLLDDSVPASMRLVWKDGDNWMEILKTALAPVGLVAEPDWSGNKISVLWSAPRPVSRPAETPVVTDAATRSPEPVGAAATPVYPVAAPSACVAARYAAISNGRLPPPDVMRKLLASVENGGLITLSGVSSSKVSARRDRYGKLFAKRLRTKLVAAGFPEKSIVLSESFSRSNKPGVKIVVGCPQVETVSRQPLPPLAPVAMPAVAMPAVAMPAVAMPAVAMPAVAMPAEEPAKQIVPAANASSVVANELPHPAAMDGGGVRDSVPAEIRIMKGDGLRGALAREAARWGVSVSWGINEDLVASRDMVFSGKSRNEVLNEILSVFRLSGYLARNTGTLYVIRESQ